MSTNYLYRKDMVYFGIIKLITNDLTCQCDRDNRLAPHQGPKTRWCHHVSPTGLKIDPQTADLVMPWLGHGIHALPVCREQRRGCRACARHDVEKAHATLKRPDRRQPGAVSANLWVSRFAQSPALARQAPHHPASPACHHHLRATNRTTPGHPNRCRSASRPFRDRARPL
jgi:hypothetical protein